MNHLPDYRVTDAWIDLTTVSGYSTTASTDIIIQAKYVGEVYVFAGGSSAPTGKQGTLLKSTESIFVNNAHVWIRGDKGMVSVLIT